MYYIFRIMLSDLVSYNSSTNFVWVQFTKISNLYALIISFDKVVLHKNNPNSHFGIMNVVHIYSMLVLLYKSYEITSNCVLQCRQCTVVLQLSGGVLTIFGAVSWQNNAKKMYMQTINSKTSCYDNCSISVYLYITLQMRVCVSFWIYFVT